MIVTMKPTFSPKFRIVLRFCGNSCCVCFVFVFFRTNFRSLFFFSISCTLHLMVFLRRVKCSLPLRKTTFELITRKMMIHFYFSPYLFNINCTVRDSYHSIGTVIRSQYASLVSKASIKWWVWIVTSSSSSILCQQTHNLRQKLLSKWKHHRLLESLRWLMKLYTSLFFPLYSEGVRYVSLGFLVIVTSIARS